MNFVKANAQIVSADYPYKMVELAGRTCYKSEDKITDDSCYDFVKKMVGRRHMAMLEHGTVYLDCGSTQAALTLQSSFNLMAGGHVLIGNLRSFYETLESIAMHGTIAQKSVARDAYITLLNAFPEVFGQIEGYDGNFLKGSMKVLSKEEYVNGDFDKSLLRHTVVFTCDRGVSHELVRHRVASFAQESTRYCNYGKNDEINVIIPYEFEEGTDRYSLWKQACESAEQAYLELVKSGVSPQWARSVLPNSLKTEVVVTANEREWQHILDLRYHGTTGAPHPQMSEVMSIAYPLLVEASEGRLH